MDCRCVDLPWVCGLKMNEQNKKFLDLSIWLAIILFIIRCLISHNTVVADWEQKHYGSFLYGVYGYAGEAVLLTSAFMALFNEWLWKIRPFNSFAKTPALCSHYKGSLVSDYDNKEREAELFVTQTFLQVSIRMKTGESSSRSLSCEIKNINDSVYLLYNYQNDPHGEIQDRSPIHYGTAMFDLTGGTNNLEGNYYTGRNTRGSMKFKKD